MIYHITSEEAWRAAQERGSYSVPSLESEGFIHFSRVGQLEYVYNNYYRGSDGLVLLCVEPLLLKAPLRYEPPMPSGPEDQLFPHLYGELNLDAVVEAVPLPAQEDSFALPVLPAPNRTQRLLVRQLGPSEGTTLHELTQAAYAEQQPIIGASSVFSETPELLGQRLSDGWTALVAELDGRPVGTVRFQPREGALYIGRLSVIPEARHRGVGRALMEAAEAWGRGLGLKEATLGTREALPWNKQLYEGIGYVPVERTEISRQPGTYFTKMAKLLTLSADPSEATTTTYESYAPRFAGRAKTRDWMQGKQIEHFCAIVPAGSTVAAVGCGPGEELEVLREAGMHVIGMDLTHAMLQLARSVGVPLLRGDLRALPLRADSVDAVWAAASLLHLRRVEMPHALAQIATTLRPGGTLFISLKEGVGEAWLELVEGQRFFAFYSADELRRLLEGAGFSVLHEWGNPPAEGQTAPWIMALARREPRSLGARLSSTDG